MAVGAEENEILHYAAGPVTIDVVQFVCGRVPFAAIRIRTSLSALLSDLVFDGFRNVLTFLVHDGDDNNTPSAASTNRRVNCGR
jgi:hypothetical protein